MTPPRPNLLLVTTDQQRYDSTGDAAPPFMRAPHFDHLRREGITFTRAYADCPICVASRLTLMTGRYVGSHGMGYNGRTSEFMGRENTLPALLRGAGYQTAAIGKMHFTPERARHGFDEMILPADYYREMQRGGHPLQPMRHGLGQNELYPGMATVPEALTLTSWIAEKCVEYVRERRDPGLPFFLWCSFSKPHPPLDPPEPYYSMYRGCPIPEPVCGDWSESPDAPAAFRRMARKQSFDRIPREVLREARAAYLGLITQVDYNMGRVFAALQDVGLFNDTLILYASDHGEYLGDHHTGSKVFFHEPSAHVPLVLRLPQSWEDRRAGARVDSLATLADVLPTLVAAAGGSPPPTVDGIDLTALARGKARPRPFLEAMSGTPAKPKYLALTDGRWKYIWYPEGPCEQLFDLEKDPKELRDLGRAAEFEGRRAGLRDELTRRLAARSSPCLQEGRLPSWPRVEEDEAEVRGKPWPGYHTENYGVDVRH
jgi:arylsulfatase A-like enzyme